MKKLRKAYVGLSTPLFYDYSQPGAQQDADVHSSPNPVLDGAFGLFFFYDEIWFLTRSLCPQNLRSASFVHYVDEEVDIPEGLLNLHPAHPEYFFADYQIDKMERQVHSYASTVSRLGVYWNARPDNHTHTLRIGPDETSAKSSSPINVIRDIALLQKMEDDSIDLITNTFTQHLFDRYHEEYSQRDLVHEL